MRSDVSTPADAEGIQSYLETHIPLSEAMGTRVVEATADRVTLEAPLEPNLNHRSTAFGGSVAALAVLAGWTQVHLRLRQEGWTTRTVIQESTVRYLAPVHGSFRARTRPLGDDAWDRFLRMLARKGKGRIRVQVEILSQGEVAGTFEGAYVALAADD